MPAAGVERFESTGAKHIVSHTVEMMLASLSVIWGGVCERFPKVRFAFLESGGGWIAPWLDRMDRHFDDNGVFNDTTLKLLPSEYFRRQVYATFWFERGSLAPALEGLQDNLMFSTDFPHPTSQTPGPASFATGPRAYMNDVLGAADPDVSRKVLQDNARHVYQLS